MATTPIPAPKAQTRAILYGHSLMFPMIRSRTASAADPPVTHATIVVICALSWMGRLHMVCVKLTAASVCLTVHDVLMQAWNADSSPPSAHTLAVSLEVQVGCVKIVCSRQAICAG
jgi:hypothetical protein